MAVRYHKDYKTGETYEADRVRFTPVEDSRGGYFKPRQFEFQVAKGDGSYTEPAKNTVASTGSGPVIILFDPKKDVVGLIEEFRLPAFFHDIEAKKESIMARPAGRVMALIMGAQMAGEAMEQTVLREASEESGVDVKRLRAGPKVLGNQAIAPDVLHYYVAEFDSTRAKNNSPQGNLSEGELITFRTMPAKQFMAMTRHTEFSQGLDAVGMMGAFWFKDNYRSIKQEWAPKAKSAACVGKAATPRQ